MKKDVEAFRAFIKKHPKLILDVRTNKRSWKDLYSDWVILGEEDECWKDYQAEVQESSITQGFKGLKARKKRMQSQEKAASSKKEMTLGDVLSVFKDMSLSDLKQHISSVSGAVEGIYELLQQFQGSKSSAPDKGRNTSDYFSIFKD
ncbi:hypothetical protein A374_12770 [Fictibacillus macauensis ZFHKF-1]|uniref:Coat protein n=1 Tax=Fictibacillus macauensis ZFHKF-1 TaxID=1196324 RepID=I8AHJ7_9BACL|nr:spore coat protein YlbD [Fictibacillus macauensis]EIT84919.1 hypothetical protein A374_12770 [Fictibacillus macauensis ZFHKF-1]